MAMPEETCGEGMVACPEAIADELCYALLAFDRVDYNALTVDELRDLLTAREIVEELCLRYRRQQSSHGAPEEAATHGRDGDV